MPSKKEAGGKPGQEQTHKQWVAGLRSYIREQQQKNPEAGTPDEIIANALLSRAQEKYGPDGNLRPLTPAEQQKVEFFESLYIAWETVAYERFPYKTQQFRTGDSLFAYVANTSKTTIRLSDPTQVDILDALCDAVDLPHRKGQNEFQIPEQTWGGILNPKSLERHRDKLRRNPDARLRLGDPIRPPEKKPR